MGKKVSLDAIKAAVRRGYADSLECEPNDCKDDLLTFVFGELDETVDEDGDAPVEDAIYTLNSVIRDLIAMRDAVEEIWEG